MGRCSELVGVQPVPASDDKVAELLAYMPVLAAQTTVIQSDDSVLRYLYPDACGVCGGAIFVGTVILAAAVSAKHSAGAGTMKKVAERVQSF